jgi:hypothetical protein
MIVSLSACAPNTPQLTGRRVPFLASMAHMNWIIWVMVLVAWPVVGLGVAYLFGRFIRGVEVPHNAADLTPPVVSYLRRSKRTRLPSRGRSANQTKARHSAR